ncbi:hypothetical protein [Salinimicrobium sp. GXAS 041]|uniref:hypothetical protein n=1 Tax=Salinimicrobium sp. GXAS 041 TaxID=3400806 RepID=UPI003C7119C3
MQNQLILPKFISYTFGILAMAISIVNTFWGNDSGYGIFIFLLPFAYFPPLSLFLHHKLGYKMALAGKILLAVFILWSALGVAELFNKIHLMLQSF